MRKIKLLFVLLITILLVGCSPKAIEITFVGQEGEILFIQTAEKGDYILYPEEPYVNGYEFVGWDKNIEKATKSMTIKALFEKCKYSVCFYDENEDLIEEQTIEYGETAIPPILNLNDEYIFIGWSEDYTFIKKDIDIYPKIEKAYFEVKFYNSYGDIIEIQSVKNGESPEVPEAPTIEGYEFKSWDKELDNIKRDLEVKPIYKKIEMGYEMENVNYWIQVLGLKHDLNKIIMTPDEIADYNKKIISDFNKTYTLDVSEIESTVSGEYVNKIITNYNNINNYTVYDDKTNQAIGTLEKNIILSNRNLDQIPATINVKYGIITDFAWVRTYPTNNYSRSYSMDIFQETTLNVGEGVAIYHESADGNWYFVQAMNYHGWVEKKNIATCSHDELKNFLKTDDKIVVISDYVILEGVHVRMGQAFPLINEDVENETYKISFPKRNNDGTLYLKEIIIDKCEDYSNGYLEYTLKNVLTQGFKLLGIKYSWGDKEKDGRDCSSTQSAIYNCFGFMMPRNCDEQFNIPTYGDKVNGVGGNYMKLNYKPGTLIYTSTHVMMYIGENDYGVSYLLHNTNAGDAGCILQSLTSYGSQKINGVLRLYN